MALVVEDGTGKSNAEAYCDVLFADVYHASRGTAEASWVGLDTDVKEQCLRRATDHMLQMYKTRWKGYAVAPSTQALDWPRSSVYPDASYLYALSDTVVPPEVQKACAELALRANTEALTEDVEPTGAVLSESVGPISVTYAQAATAQKKYTMVDRILGPLLTFGSGEMQGTARLG